MLGAPRSGKSNLIRTLVAALALTHTPDEVQVYIFDFGGGGMVSLDGLPHVGGVVQRRDREGVTRTIAELVSLLEYREALFTEHRVESMAAYRKARAEGRFVDEPFGDVFLVIDGWQTLRTEYEPQEQAIQEIATQGLTYGVHLVVSSGRWSEIRPWLRSVLQTRFELRMGDPMESEIDFRKARDIPEIPGRGMTVDKFHFLSALPRIDNRTTADDVGEAVGELVAAVRDNWSGPPAPVVRLLPRTLPASQLPAPPRDVELRVALGLDDQRLAPVWHDFAVTPHLLVFGDSQSGKTNLLALLIQAITTRFSPDEARIVLVDPRRRLQAAVPPAYLLANALNGNALRDALARVVPMLKERVPGPDMTPEQLTARNWWTGPRVFVVMDDYDVISGSMDYPAESLTDLLSQGVEVGLHLVVARTVNGAMRAMMEPMVRRMWDLGTPGLLFSCPRGEGAFLGDARPVTLPPGRAQSGAPQAGDHAGADRSG